MISRGPFQPLQFCDSPFCEVKTCSSQLLSSMLWDDIGYLLLKHPYGSHPNITSLTTLQQHMRRAPDWHISGGPVAISSHRCPMCLHIYSHAPMQQASLISCSLCGKETATGWLNSKKQIISWVIVQDFKSLLKKLHLEPGCLKHFFTTAMKIDLCRYKM